MEVLHVAAEFLPDRQLRMKSLAAAEVAIVFAGTVVYIWRWQGIYPDFPIYLLGFIVATFFLHRDSPRRLGLGSHGFLSSLRYIWRPSLAAATCLILIGWMTGSPVLSRLAHVNWGGFGRYFAWCLLQQFGLQSFFSNRVSAFVEKPNHAAWLSAAMFGAFHLPNPVLLPVTFLGGYFLSRLFLSERNLVPLALAQALVGSLLSITLPISWHHGLRVGPGYYRR
jgi:hypothetical protein